MYKRRLTIFLVLIAASLLVLLGRLGYLQIVQGDEHRRRFEESLLRVQLLSFNRGRILDRTGEHPLAEDVPCFDFCLEYGFLTGDERWARRRQREIRRSEKVSEAQAVAIYDRRAENTWRLARQLAVSNGIELDVVIARIRARVRAVLRSVRAARPGIRSVREEGEAHAVVHGMDEPVPLDSTVGAVIRPSRKRGYPYEDMACHIIGAVGPVFREEAEELNLTRSDESDWLTRMRVNYLPDDIIGKIGVEKGWEETLRGRRGYRQTKRTTGEPQLLGEAPTERGRDVHLTLDVDLQQAATGLLRGRGLTGSIVVLGVPSGEVLAMVSLPSYDANRYWRDRQLIYENQVDLPWLHRAVAKRYPPGSTAKPIAALGGLSSGQIEPGTSFECRGYLHRPDRFRCWIYTQHRGAHGTLDMADALKHSCNIYFYRVGGILGGRQMSMWLNLFGFGDVAGTGLPEERRGLVPTEAYLRRVRPDQPRFLPADARFMAIGQGFFEATPLHVANAMATIARGGEVVSPLLVLEGGPKRVRRKLPLTPEQIDVVQRGMYRVAHERGGTAVKSFGRVVRQYGIEACAKTGTAETAPHRVDSDGDGRRDRIVRSGDTAWLAGFAPYRDPKVAFAVTVEYVQSGGGASNAGPIAAELLRHCQRFGYLR